MQNVTILGTTLQERSIQESLSVSKRFLGNGALDVVAYIDHGVLIKAEHDEKVREFLNRTALTVWEDKKILKLVGIADQERVKEVETRVYLKELLNLMSENNLSVAVAGEDIESIENLKSELLALDEKIDIVHSAIIDSNTSAIPEDEINGINEHAPAIVISRMGYNKQEDWLRRTSSMINAGIWLAMPANMVINGHRQSSMIGRFFNKLSFKIFSRRAKRAMEG